MRRRDFLAAGGVLALAGCSRSRTTSAAPPATTAPTSASAAPTTSAAPSPTPTPAPTAGTPAEIAARSVVPALCYHQLREFEPDDGAYTRTITTPPGVFRAQMQALCDGGRTPITAAALIEHLELGTPLPAKPVLLTFDDGSATHATVALPVLQELGFPGVFPMTVVLGKEHWLSEDDLRRVDAAGMEIGAHTWDHQRLDRLPDDQSTTQLDEPRATLGAILGHPVDLMAYPYGAWAPATLPHVTSAGYRAAFQLSDPVEATQPLLTIRRIMPPPTWDGATFLAHLDSDFGPAA
ncbi:polysaccharide deacetylase family protein [Modestobacter muralis]|uniref:Polysaccharide deacetylase family protein n=1 Tax=Modestobacter muralis TaxID=1608614 RepID=A0A6P0HA47_9ACTN|nr:polysaccharide deacetylase family protein [Modestobacter muralis]NEN51919.1 polysaccharide deacetylase family protein [Modestobacter muralis]